MREHGDNRTDTLALNTNLEADFIQPLTALRGALEILRDYPDLSETEHEKFVRTALWGCQRLEDGVDHLAEAVYGAAERDNAEPPDAGADAFANRIRFIRDTGVIELNFEDFEFSSARLVNQFYDAIERAVAATGRRWYMLINIRNCRIWPEAWVAFAHRAKKINEAYSLGTVRYAERDPADSANDGRSVSTESDPDLCSSRDAALAQLTKLRAGS